MHVTTTIRNGVCLALSSWMLFAPGYAAAGWETVCERVPTTKMLPGTINRPVFVAEPALRCKRVWTSETPLEPEIEDITFTVRDLDRVCLELDYPLDRCWEILAGLEASESTEDED